MKDQTHKCEPCQDRIKSIYLSKMQTEVDVTAVPPKPVDGMPHEAGEHECPHGTTFYALPTINQVAQWAFRGIR